VAKSLKVNNSEQLRMLDIAPLVTELDLSQFYNINEVDFLTICAKKNLRNLNLEKILNVNFFSSEDAQKIITLLSSLQDLECLSLSNCDALIDFEVFQHFKSLKDLNLSWTEIKDEDLKYLNNLKKLRFLSLSNCDLISGEGFKYLENLQHLYLTGCDNLDWQYLQSLPKLRGLTISSINAFNIEMVKKLKNIDHLRIVNPELGEEEIRQLFQSIPTLKNISITCPPNYIQELYPY
jgi:hypothetical protein